VRPRSLGLACALLGAVGFSFKAVLVKAAYRYGVDPETLLALRMLYSLPLFLLMGYVAARNAANRSRGGGLARAAGARGARLLRLELPGFPGAAPHLGGARAPDPVHCIRPSWCWSAPGASGARRARDDLIALALCYAGVALVVTHDVRANRGHVPRRHARVRECHLLRGLPAGRRTGAHAARLHARRGLGHDGRLRGSAAAVRGAAAASDWRSRNPGRCTALSAAMAVFSTVLPIWLVSEAIRRLGAGPTAMIGSLGPPDHDADGMAAARRSARRAAAARRGARDFGVRMVASPKRCFRRAATAKLARS
jgi:hypothetical protein